MVWCKSIVGGYNYVNIDGTLQWYAQKNIASVVQSHLNQHHSFTKIITAFKMVWFFVQSFTSMIQL